VKKINVINNEIHKNLDLDSASESGDFKGSLEKVDLIKNHSEHVREEEKSIE